MTGYVHSLESFGTVDGPGVRYVVFFQGCPMRCQYCHNPDTWQPGQGTPMEAEMIIGNIVRNREFYQTGGITATGGEPLLQLDFLIELFRQAKQAQIHTCLDTSGILFREDEEHRRRFEQLVQVTDLVMLDIKHMDMDAHIKLTGQSNEPVFQFAKFLEKHQIPLWVRRVVVPGVTDTEQELRQLGQYIKGLTNFKELEVLPYHTMAKTKYERMGIPFPLEGIPPLTREEAKQARRIILQ